MTDIELKIGPHGMDPLVFRVTVKSTDMTLTEWGEFVASWAKAMAYLVSTGKSQ